MRLDLFLKQSRLIKQRTWAKELCDAGRVRVNNAVAKASREVGMGDTLCLELMSKRLTLKILFLPTMNLSKAKAKECYQILSEEPLGDYSYTPDIWDQ